MLRTGILALIWFLALFVAKVPAYAEGPQCRIPQEKSQRGPSSVSGKGSSDIKIIQLDPDMPLEEMALEGYEVVSYEDFVGLDPWTAPDPVLRDRIFSQAEITKHLRGWDQLARDMLFLRAQEQGLSTLKKKYSNVPAKALKSLIEIIQAEKRKGVKK